MTSSEIIARILDSVNLAEITHNPYEFMEARRLLCNDLRQAIRSEVQDSTETAICQNLTPGVSVVPAYELSFTPDGDIHFFPLGGEA